MRHWECQPDQETASFTISHTQALEAVAGGPFHFESTGLKIGVQEHICADPNQNLQGACRV